MLLSLLLCSLLSLVVSVRDFHIDYANDQFVRDGKPFRYISGSIHYFRTHPDQWEDRLKMARAAGLNAIQTYIPWNYHNTFQGQFDFSGPRNFSRFFSLAASQDLAVIVRPGPYVCGEWENGGLPYWLLKYPNITLRSSQDDFLREALGWWDILLPMVKPLLWNNGGPIIMTQLENEYGSYGDDAVYKNALRDKAVQLLGPTAVLFTTDPPEVILLGKIDGVFATVDFGERGLLLGDEYFKIQQDINAHSGPRVNSEYYPGWYATWGEKGPYKDFTTGEVLQMTEFLWSRNASFNYYMFHGGTNFGFWNGAEYAGGLITSYDYWAPMRENGVGQPKYDAIRKFIGSIPDWPNKPQPVPTPIAGLTGRGIALAKYGNIYGYLPQLINQSRCQVGMKTFEELDQPFGYVQYSIPLSTNVKKVKGDGVRDFGFTFLNQQYKGTFSPEFKHRKVSELSIGGKSGDQLDVFVENQGRLTWETRKDYKGLLTSLLGDGNALTVGTSCPIDIDQLPLGLLKESTIKNSFVPGDVYIGQFVASRVADTNIDMSSWGKGVVWVNGVNIGRYWSTQGPQKSLYIPAPLLKDTNEVVIVEWEQLSSSCIASTAFCSFDLLADAITF